MCRYMTDNGCISIFLLIFRIQCNVDKKGEKHIYSGNFFCNSL